MFKKLYICILLFILSDTLHSQDNSLDEGVLISNITIITDSEYGIVQFKGYVVIQNGIIKYVNKKKPILKRNYTQIDGKGKFLTPGLIDTHVHLANIAGVNYKLSKQYPHLKELYYQQLPKSYLYFGYTTLVDLNNYAPEIVDKIKIMPIVPDIFTCGEQIEVKNGFMMAETDEVSIETDFPNYLIDHYKDDYNPTDQINHSPKDVVKTLKDQHSICIKTLYEDGFGGTEEVTWAMPSLQIIKDVVNEANNFNMPVLMHANSYESQKFAYDAGVNIIAHGMWHWGDLLEFKGVKELPNTHSQLLKAIAHKKIGYQPTFRVIAGQRDLFNSDFLNHPDLNKITPEAFLTFLNSEEAMWQVAQIKSFAKQLLGELTDRELFDFFQEMVDKIGVSAKLISAEDGLLLFGTDSPAMNAHTNTPGLNGFLEMIEWQKAGISLQTLFKACTSNNAKALNLDNVGTIEIGKKANLLILNKNPLETIEAYNGIEMVILNGTAYSRDIFRADLY